MTPFIDNTINLTDLMYLTEDAKIDYNHIIQLPPEVLKKMRDELNKEDIDIMEKAQGKQMYNTYARGMSTQGRDHADAIIKAWLEEYDKEMDEAILASDDIVKAYNDFISGEFDRLTTSNAYKLKENDIISVRKYGKFQYCKTVSETRKGRLSVIIKRYK